MTVPVRAVVALLTYRRPHELHRGLSLVLEQVRRLNAREQPSVTATVLVVDNDPQGSAHSVVEAVDTDLVRYVLESTPGISAARNRALDESGDVAALVFIDDDESPRDGWLSALIDTWLDTQAAAVMGPVHFPVPDDVDPWIVAGGFFDRRRMATGTEIAVAAAGNLLLDLAQVRRLGVRFDPRLGLSGGEDTLFSKQLTRRGGRIVWCDEAVADHDVAAQRTTRRWVLKRAWRSGNSAAIADLYQAQGRVEAARARARALSHGTIRVLAGSLRAGLGIATRSTRHEAAGLRTVQRGRGMLAGTRGVRYQEYARRS